MSLKFAAIANEMEMEKKEKEEEGDEVDVGPSKIIHVQNCKL